MTKVGEVTFDFDGRPLTASDGQTLAAALISNDILSWRTTRLTHQPRGVFCGIGLCFDCLVVLNGNPNVRACLITVHQGDVVRSQFGTGHDDLTT